VDLLWTGGWDSTFRLLSLLLSERRHVTPHYLIDAERPSTYAELHAMKRIGDRLLREHPAAEQLLEATRYYAVTDIAPDPEMTGAFEAILGRRFLGSQWSWIPRFSKEHGFTDLQLSVHRHDKTHAVLEGMMTKASAPADAEGSAGVYRVDPRFSSTDEYKLFGRFVFPLFDLSKPEMAALAGESGWRGIMEMTWFCHLPRRGMAPCGRCAPCRSAMAQGLGWRIPARNRVLSRLEGAVVDPLRSSAKQVVRRAALRRR
jgi:hypothetical protein